MDCINIYELLVFANHGVLKEENVLGQKFIVSARLFLDTKKAAKNDNVDETVNYALVCKLITKHFQNNTYKLIETAANETAQLILKEFELVESIELEVKKPWAPVHLALESVSVKIQRKRHNVYISLGSNMGDKIDNLNKALQIINDDELSYVSLKSDYIQTKPYGYEEQDDFVNAAALIKTLRSPEQFMELISRIEKELDRQRLIHWGPRTIDVDILLYDDEIIYNKDLIVPHIDMQNRNFVLEPMIQIAPGVNHPVLQKSMLSLYLDLNK